MENGMELLKEKSPPHYTLCVEALECEIFVVGMDVQFFASKKHVAVLFESFNYGENFFLADRVISLSTVELARVKGYGNSFLKDCCPQLQITGITIYMKWFIVIGVTQERVLGQERFCGFEGLLAFM
mmetsp:Transcript_88180/g.254338  ORF Transcript_88180/g.254338 Transcript_88180/m.254338 type:complete len:127 (-) Transcript_88180:1774-2154(-)